MNERKLRDRQNALMTEREEWKALQGEFSHHGQSKEWHECEQEMQILSEECDDIRRMLFDVGYCE